MESHRWPANSTITRGCVALVLRRPVCMHIQSSARVHASYDMGFGNPTTPIKLVALKATCMMSCQDARRAFVRMYLWSGGSLFPDGPGLGSPCARHVLETCGGGNSQGASSNTAFLLATSGRSNPFGCPQGPCAAHEGHKQQLSADLSRWAVSARLHGAPVVFRPLFAIGVLAGHPFRIELKPSRHAIAPTYLGTRHQSDTHELHSPAMAAPHSHLT